jgi:amidohydrolase
VAEEADQAVALRRTIHSHPELGNAEFRTTGAVTVHLEAGGLDPVVRATSVGLHVDVGGPGPMVVFRADLDALPVSEESGVPFASEVPGVMHACGHDAHTAIAAGLARSMSRLDLPGTVRFLFQPAEETVPGGAVELVKEGLVTDAASIMAFHVDPSIPPGTVGIRADAITGASDRIRIELIGPGGHTSRPHQTVDLVHAAARIVTDLPQLIQRSTDPRNPVAVVFGRISGGTAENVIPTSVEVAGTPLGATARVDYERGAPPVVNDRSVVGTIERAALSILGPEGVLPTEQSLGAEDFAWYLEEVPGALIRLGAGPTDRSVDLHAADFDLDERAIATGMLLGGAALLALLDAAV